MTASESPEPGVWQQLRRRRVTRTVVTYLSVGFAVLETVWYLVPRYGLIDEVGRVATGVLVLGFPVAVVLAWTFDLTPEGIVRTPDRPGSDALEPPNTLVRRSSWLVLCAGLIAIGVIFRWLRL